MALKDLFKMTKADKYTADGCEELNKAREADVEDKVYQIGEISQKTGLQKTANGWVKPKNGKQPGAKKENPTRTFEFKSGPDGMPVAGSGKEVKTYKTKKEAETALKKQNAAAGSKPAAQEVKLGGGADTYYFEDPDNMSNEDKVFKSLGIELAETFGDHDGEPGNTETWANGWLDNIMDNGGLGIKSKKTRQPAAPVPAEEVMRIVEENPARWNRIIGNAKKFYEGKGRSTDFESDEFYPIKLVGGKTKPSAQYYAEGKRNEKNNPLTGKYVTQRQNTSKDAAPRQLTGDTRLHLSQVKDKVYQIGEISQKTGLQKTANGWVKPKGKGPNMNAEAEKHAETRKDRESAGAKQKLSENYKEEVKEFVSSATPERVQRYIKALRTPFSIESDSFEEPEKLAAALEEELKKKPESKPEEQNKSAGQYSVENLPAVGSDVTFEGKINGKPIEGKGNVVGFITKNNKTYARVKTNEGSYDVNLSLLRGGRSGKDANKGKVITGNVEGKGGLWEPIYGEPQEDSAPRQLTGDCKIRVKK